MEKIKKVTYTHTWRGVYITTANSIGLWSTSTHKVQRNTEKISGGGWGGGGVYLEGKDKVLEIWPYVEGVPLPFP